MGNCLAVLVFLVCLPVAGLANTVAGNALIVTGVVTATAYGSGLRILSKRPGGIPGDTVSTANDSFVALKMNDKSKVSLRPLSELALENISEENGKDKALFAEEKQMRCSGTPPDFLANDSYLSADPGKAVTLFNVLENIEEQQRCEIPEA